MLDKIVAKLKTGRIINVIPYGSKKLPAPPYIVVKPETDVAGRGRSFRVIVHMEPGQQLDLEDYVFNDLSELLNDIDLLSRHGNRNILYYEQEYTDIIVNNDDGSISMERLFLLPSRIF